ncbi:3-coathanger stack domain-containing protein, partial [Emticicia fontis]
QLNCTSDSSDVSTITVNPVPAKPTISPASLTICSGVSTTLLASACTGGTLRWTGGLTGTSITISPTATKSYKVACTQLNCTSDSSDVSVITVNPTPTAPTISATSTAICKGTNTTLSVSGCSGGIVKWTGGLTGSSIIVSPVTTKNYKAVCTQISCTSDSSEATIITVKPIPTAPVITADSTTICNGQTLLLRASCASGAVSWNPSGTGSTHTISTTGTYTAVCIDNGCTSPSGSIVITSGSCRFTSINPVNPVICPGKSITLTISGCNGGSISWSGGETGAGTSITVSPAVTTTYTAVCSLGSSANTTVTIAQNNILISNDVLTGTVIEKAAQTIESDKEIGSLSITPKPNVTYFAANSIVLKPGFMVENGAVFKAEIQGCN